MGIKVAPGNNVVRVDNVKEKSWVDVRAKNGRIGQIFFATDSSKLDFADMAQLDKIDAAYGEKLHIKRVPFLFLGYADYRHSKEHNYQLSEDRAKAVAAHLNPGQQQRLSRFPKTYAPDARGMGVDYSVDTKFPQGRPTNSKDLAPYRRVDIFAEPIYDHPPTPPAAPKGTIRSKTWQARLIFGASISYGAFKASTVYLEVVALDPSPVSAPGEKWVSIYNLTGLGAGVGVGVSWVPKSPGSVSGPSKWYKFDTGVPVSFKEMQGIATHVSGKIQVPAGVSTDMIFLMGPWAQKGGDVVMLAFASFSVLKPSVGVGASTVIGTLDLTDDNNGKPRPWP